MGQLDGKTALVTGAGRGIGRATTKLLAAEGATVLAVARTPQELGTLGAEIEAAGGRFYGVAGDITDEEFLETLFSKVVDEHLGRLDILVNNAGIAPFGPVEDMPVATFRACLELNVVAVFACMQQAVRRMKESGGGRIINIGSVRSHWTEGGDAGAYNASKEGVRALTESVARQLHGPGNTIAVSLVCPGVVDTTLTNPKLEPRPTWLQPETLARAVLYAATAPDGVNVFDVTLFPLTQRPW